MKDTTDGTNDFYELYNSYNSGLILAEYEDMCKHLNKVRQKYLKARPGTFAKVFAYNACMKFRISVNALHKIIKERDLQ